MEAVVVDAGSKLFKAGFAVPDKPPSTIMPSQIRKVRSLHESAFVDPVVRGFISDWDAMEELLNDVLYNGLGWEIGNEGQILFAEPLATPKAVREQLVQMMFEKFNVAGFFSIEQAVLSLYAVGRTSGCCIDVGHGKMASCQMRWRHFRLGQKWFSRRSNTYITKAEYDEMGPSIVHLKCF